MRAVVDLQLIFFSPESSNNKKIDIKRAILAV